jgi:hypothetical protein
LLDKTERRLRFIPRQWRKGVPVTDSGVDKLADFDVIAATPVTGQ